MTEGRGLPFPSSEGTSPQGGLLRSCSHLASAAMNPPQNPLQLQPHPVESPERYSLQWPLPGPVRGSLHPPQEPRLLPVVHPMLVSLYGGPLVPS